MINKKPPVDRPRPFCYTTPITTFTHPQEPTHLI